VVVVYVCLPFKGLLLGIDVPLLVYVEGVSFGFTVNAKPVMIHWLVLVAVLVYRGFSNPIVRLFKSNWIVRGLNVSW
jgi:hypothetical protein